MASEFLKHGNNLFSLRMSFIVQDNPFWISLSTLASISMNTNRFPILGKAIFYLSAPLKMQHPNIPLHFSSVILLVKRAVKASQETVYIFPHFNTTVTQYKKGELISLPRDGTTKESVSSSLEGLCSTQI